MLSLLFLLPSTIYILLLITSQVKGFRANPSLTPPSKEAKSSFFPRPDPDPPDKSTGSAMIRLSTFLRNNYCRALSSSSSLHPTLPHLNLNPTTTTRLFNSKLESLLATKSNKLLFPEELKKTHAPSSSSNYTLPTDEPLKLLRERMVSHNIDACIVSEADPHLSEYVSAAYERRAFVSNFDGSAGIAVVTATEALLWTDSRYYDQAGLQLNLDLWKVMRSGDSSTLTIPSWLDSASKSRSSLHTKSANPFKIGLDPFVHSASFVASLEALPSKTVSLVTNLSVNLVDSIWPNRPSLPSSPFRVHPLKFAGVTANDKIAAVRGKMIDHKASLAVFSALDDIAYLLNLRASDIQCCPVGIAYALIGRDFVKLYTEESVKVVTDEVISHLSESGVTLVAYDDLLLDLKAHVADNDDNKVWLDSARTNYAITNNIPVQQLINKQNAIAPMKAIKNKEEIDGMRHAHVLDGVAMAGFVSWLEKEVRTRSVSEIEVDEVLNSARAVHESFLEPSFETIAGVGRNGAIVHYRAKEDASLGYLTTEQPILIDSGGQYKMGTTDVTRTWWFGKPTGYFKECYSNVLKGHIGLDSAVFPDNTPGMLLDSFARRSLWREGMDYGHGTGHGVGAALNVHEGPQGISPRANPEGLKEGMVLSNEPGYYEPGNFGIRIENLCLVREKKFPSRGALVEEEEEEEGVRFGRMPPNTAISVQRKFLCFERITMIPIQKDLIEVSMMEAWELDWLDEYHADILAKVGPLLEEGSDAKEWLVRMCEKIERHK